MKPRIEPKVEISYKGCRMGTESPVKLCVKDKCRTCSKQRELMPGYASKIKATKNI